MARPLRIEYEGAFYHITARGNEGREIYFANSDYEKFKSYLKQAQEKYGCLLHCYVLMTNHYHLLMQTPRGNLSKVMHYINASYTNYINKKHQRSGHLFQGRYKAILVEHDSYLLELSRYLHLNPVRAHLVASPEGYPHSSYRSYISGTKDDILFRDLILGMISKDRKVTPKHYREFVEKAIETEPESPFKSIYGGVILGGQKFVKEVLSRLEETALEQKDISHRRELQAAWRTDDVIEVVATHFNLSRDQLIKDRKIYRNMTIYLPKKYTGMTNRQIGQLFGELSYSAVVKVHRRFEEILTEDRSLSKTLKEITKKMSHVKT